jgi:hypothetical protein
MPLILGCCCGLYLGCWLLVYARSSVGSFGRSLYSGSLLLTYWPRQYSLEKETSLAMCAWDSHFSACTILTYHLNTPHCFNNSLAQVYPCSLLSPLLSLLSFSCTGFFKGFWLLVYARSSVGSLGRSLYPGSQLSTILAAAIFV